MSTSTKPTILIICDGFGIAPKGKGNAVTRAKMPVLERLVRSYPAMTLQASGAEVGLSWGVMGNSEVGHMTIGAGRVAYQLLARIDQSIESGTFFKNEALISAMDQVKKTGGTLHLAGLISPGKVHGMDAHCLALLEMAKKRKCKDVAVHAFMDGRDTLYNAGIDFMGTFLTKMKKIKVGTLASMVGRAYALDRNEKYDRTKLAYEVMAEGKGEKTEDPLEAIKASYKKEVYDEMFPPTVIVEGEEPPVTVKDGDAIIFFNFRSDRMRQLVHAFADEKFSKFPREKKDVFIVTMAEYEAGLPVQVAFPPEPIKNCLAEAVADAGLSQLHIAETEKYPHVTFFLNGTREEPFPKEKRIIIPSPSVSSYDKKPEMSAIEITKNVVADVKKHGHDLIVVNFANGDMVAHTGNLKASIEAMETIDECIGKIVETTLEQEGVVFVTGDHGNAEEVENLRTGEIDTEHSTNPVPFIVVGKRYEGVQAPSGPVPDGDLSLVPPVGMLADVAPTVLSVMGLKVPKEMTGRPLI
ncbi:2,3-bisphosphoglycerate-independent phosphoglycerate mutase [Candidatus Uhrbacteria bacterium]|nr:2,3-bisphosphoglycerate-independent phosphoglycerate mutase [Candidatus Uhrbacteria bacterium]